MLSSVQQKPDHPAVIVAAYRRAKSLQRLLNALSSAQYDVEVPLVISIDRDADNADVLEVAEGFDWRFGEKSVRQPERHLGLREHILSCGDLTDEFGSIILLEDDLVVSPGFYSFACQALAFYQSDPKIAGISMYSRQRNFFSGGLRFTPIDDCSDVFFMQCACSWGQVLTRSWWQTFRSWLESGQPHDFDTSIPAVVRSWPESSWLKYRMKYLVDRGRYYVYPRKSFSTNFADPGQHVSNTTNSFQVPLMLSATDFRFRTLADSNAVYDVFHELLVSRFNRLVPELESFDYEVDLFGDKSNRSDAPPLVLSLKACRDYERSWGWRMSPPELNVVFGVEGEAVFLARRDAFDPSSSAFDTRFDAENARLSARVRLTQLLNGFLSRLT